MEEVEEDEGKEERCHLPRGGAAAEGEEGAGE